MSISSAKIELVFDWIELSNPILYSQCVHFSEDS